MFLLEISEFPHHREVEFSIVVMPRVAPTLKEPYRMRTLELVELKLYLKEMLDKGYIRPSVSSWGEHVHFVKNKDGTIRLCIDCSQLKKVSVQNMYPFMYIDDLFLVEGRNNVLKYSFEIRISSGVHKKKKDIWKTTLCTRYANYLLLVAPFCFTNPPSNFMCLMNSVFHPYLYKFVIVFIDDILIYSKNEEENGESIKELILLREHDLYANLSKYSFF